MRISVFGIGYVGVVSSGCLVELGHEVIGVDVSAEKIAMLAAGRSPIVEEAIDTLIADAVNQGKLTATDNVEDAVNRTDVSFISVGTPSAADGSVALGAVDSVVAAIGRAIRGKSGSHAVVMRSTVPPGTAEDRVIPILERESGRVLGEQLRYYSNPEFLREGSSVRDFRSPPFTLIGAAAGDDAEVLRAIYAPIAAPVHVAPYRVAESVKHISNVYHAVKLAFANEAGAILASHGVDAREAFRLLCEDKVLNVSAAYLRPGFAFGGSCLPKDVRSFLSLADAHNLSTPFLKQLLPGNQAIIDRAFEAITRHGRLPIALFGLAFKQGTDDLRESPFVLLAERLLGRGYELRIYDRFVQVARLMGANRSYIDKEIPHLERLLVDGPQAALSASRIAVIGHVAPEDQPALLAGLTDHVVIDLAGMDTLRTVPGIVYEGLCW
ncbi:MAG: UDP-glucose/GDP-mannose dehydrogenase family protein [Acetobacteraceae bacterium]|nr:UDP-glucose/GDP-mannose dehydrogenase family protein [Acetobacteraceae bacterium]